MRSLYLLCLLVAAMGLSGCQAALNDSRTVRIESTGIHSVLYDPQQRAKMVRIEVKSSGGPIDAYLVLEKDRAGLEKQLSDLAKPSGQLAEAIKTESALLQANIPAKTPFSLVLVNRHARGDVSVQVKASESR